MTGTELYPASRPGGRSAVLHRLSLRAILLGSQSQAVQVQAPRTPGLGLPGPAAGTGAGPRTLPGSEAPGPGRPPASARSGGPDQGRRKTLPGLRFRPQGTVDGDSSLEPVPSLASGPAKSNWDSEIKSGEDALILKLEYSICFFAQVWF